MPVEVLIGYRDDGGYHGYFGTLKVREYELLRRLAERASGPGNLSEDELKALSDVKDLIIKAQIRLHEIPSSSKERLYKYIEVREALGRSSDSFNTFDDEAAQLRFLLSFCILDAQYLEWNDETDNYESENFEYVDQAEEEVPLLDESIEVGAIKHIAVSEGIVSTIYEWIALDGRRLLNEASMAEDDEDMMETEIKWWRDNISYFEEEPDYDLTTMLFRALRNNELKCRRTGKPVLSSRNWSRRIEIL
jgi:hypothetical protein